MGALQDPTLDRFNISESCGPTVQEEPERNSKQNQAETRLDQSSQEGRSCRFMRHEN